MIECKGGGIYIGISDDVDRRYADHVAGKGAKYTKLNPPVRLVAKKEFPDRKSAAQEEYRMKRLSTLDKHKWAWALQIRPARMDELGDSVGS